MIYSSQPRRSRRRATLLLTVAFTGALACDGGRATVQIVAQDTRFEPNVVHVRRDVRLLLSLYNAGRESHEFSSPILSYAHLMPEKSGLEGIPPPSPLPLNPGRTVRLLVDAPGGTYLFWCARKGHPNMSGTLIID